MLYSELAKTYRKLFKKYPNISSLQDFGGKILEEKTTYAKRGTRWVEVKKEEKEVSATYVFNVFDAVQFFKDLGGYEKSKLRLYKGRISSRRVTKHQP